VNSLPKTVTRQRRGCDLNPGPSAPESSMLITRLPGGVSKQISKVTRTQQFAKSPHRYGNSHSTWDHTVLPAIRQR